MLLLLDLSAAFDTVDHAILLNRLTWRFGIKNRVLAWFASYLKKRHQFVSVNGLDSRQCELLYGLPQGSVLGPILYLMYAYPLGNIVRRHDMSFHFYADDSQIYLSFESTVPGVLIASKIEQVVTWTIKDTLVQSENFVFNHIRIFSTILFYVKQFIIFSIRL